MRRIKLVLLENRNKRKTKTNNSRSEVIEESIQMFDEYKAYDGH